jgi:hypothetical protein
VHVIVLDSVLHCGTTIAVINAKSIERQHVSTTHCSNYHTPNAMFDTAHTVPARKGRCRNHAAVSELLKPCDARLLRCYPISTRINHVANTPRKHSGWKRQSIEPDLIGATRSRRRSPPHMV